MARKFKFCIHCRRTITEHDVNLGKFVHTQFGMLCPDCAKRLAEEAKPEDAAAHAAPPVQQEPVNAPEPPEPAKKPESPEKAEKRRDKLKAKSAPQPAASEKKSKEDAVDAAEKGDPVEILSGIHRHAEAIHRTLIFEKTSRWTVLAATAQALAIMLLIVAAIVWTGSSGPENVLLAALVFQVMALTFFVRSK